MLKLDNKYVAIFTKSYMVQADMDNREANGEEVSTRTIDNGEYLNTEHSGFYTVTGISYVLEGGYLTTHLDLRKRAIKITKQQ